jgi:hypothetical protein
MFFTPNTFSFTQNLIFFTRNIFEGIDNGHIRPFLHEPLFLLHQKIVGT